MCWESLVKRKKNSASVCYQEYEPAHYVQDQNTNFVLYPKHKYNKVFKIPTRNIQGDPKDPSLPLHLCQKEGHKAPQISSLMDICILLYLCFGYKMNIFIPVFYIVCRFIFLVSHRCTDFFFFLQVIPSTFVLPKSTVNQSVILEHLVVQWPFTLW